MQNFANTTPAARPLGKRTFPLNANDRAAAEAWLEFGERAPSKPRLASSLVLLKDSAAGLQTLLTYRPGNSPLGTVAFPGGTVLAADDDVTDWVGPSPSAWAKTLGLSDVAVAKRHVVAAIRETFEETGILLAGPDAGSLVEGVSGADWMTARRSIAAQESTFAELLERRGLALRTDLLKPLGHWLTPDFAHRRFDTRYFAAAAPIGQQPQLLDGKGVWARWVSTAELVASREGTSLGDEIALPTTAGQPLTALVVPAVAVMLEKLSQARGCIAYLNHKRPASEYKPELVTAADGTLLLEVSVAPASEGAACRER